MKLKEIIDALNFPGRMAREWNQRVMDDQVTEAVNTFNIQRIDGTDYITFNGAVISRKGDTDLLDRMEELREKYITKKTGGSYVPA